MKTKSALFQKAALGSLCLGLILCAACQGRQAEVAETGLSALLPEIQGWKQSEEIQIYYPESLFEYINGAAESYLSYDFEELLVAQYEKAGEEDILTLEIYDMGSPQNAFGIFSAERYPDNTAVSIGDLGYIEVDVLNFMAGSYYVKLLTFGPGDDDAAVLKAFSGAVSDKIPNLGQLPGILQIFPPDNLVLQSEKFVKKNFMGYEFLQNGYVATYSYDDSEIEGFFIEGESEEAAETMLNRLLDFFIKDGQEPEKIDLGYHITNRYSQHIFIGRRAHIIFGATRIPEGGESAGEGIMQKLGEALDRYIEKGT